MTWLLRTFAPSHPRTLAPSDGRGTGLTNANALFWLHVRRRRALRNPRGRHSLTDMTELSPGPDRWQVGQHPRAGNNADQPYEGGHGEESRASEATAGRWTAAAAATQRSQPRRRSHLPLLGMERTEQLLRTRPARPPLFPHGRDRSIDCPPNDQTALITNPSEKVPKQTTNQPARPGPRHGADAKNHAGQRNPLALQIRPSISTTQARPIPTRRKPSR